jgi:hypothetical protein
VLTTHSPAGGAQPVSALSNAGCVPLLISSQRGEESADGTCSIPCSPQGSAVAVPQPPGLCLSTALSCHASPTRPFPRVVQQGIINVC